MKFFILFLCSTLFFIVSYQRLDYEFKTIQVKIKSSDSLALQIKLGRMLFYEKQLSRDSTISCGSCHLQEFAFADTVQFSKGIKNRKPSRNTPTLTNIGQNQRFMFDGFLTTLEKQIIVPIEEHNEMDFSLLEASKRLNENKKYRSLAVKIFNRNVDPFVITRAIAAFERSLISNQSKYDLMKSGKVVFSSDEKEGMNLFFNKLNCIKCHSDQNFGNQLTFNNGLSEEYLDLGRFRVTLKEEDKAKFKVPTLRNIALTRPYMHDGSLPDLLSVIRHYESGGHKHVNKSEFIQAFKLTEKEEKQLIAFLESLTDETFIKNKAFRPLKR